MKGQFYRFKLDDLFSKAPEIELDDTKRYVIFSDLHLGDGKSLDDFRSNAALFMTALKDYYYEKGFILILNGDVEELHRYSLTEIRKAWTDLYTLIDTFEQEKRLYKIYGNHDSKLFNLSFEPNRYKLYESIKFNYKGKSIFLFHGHQPSWIYEKFNELMGFVLRIIAKPLRIRHYSVAYDKQRQSKIEKRTYDYSRDKGIISIIGHTHRPLFESFSKLDSLNYQIEKLLRKHAKSGEAKQKRIEVKIEEIKAEIEKHLASSGKEQTLNSLYSGHTIVPSVFNSGCVIGKRGMTALEIKNGEISLVHWFDNEVDSKYRKDNKTNTKELGESGYFRTVLKSDPLDYIFTRIRLLT